MSDDEITYVKKQKVVHYGSLEEKERQKLSSKSGGHSAGKSNKSGNVNVSNEYLDIEDEAVNKERLLVLEEFERRKKARQIAVSTDDVEVRAHLRHLNEPICKYNFVNLSEFNANIFIIKGLFGEGPAERRERLRFLLARLGQDAIKKKRDDDRGVDEKDREVIS